MSARAIVCVIVGAFPLMSGCTGGVATLNDSAPLVGSWNGPHASLSLTSSGGTIEYDCGHGMLRSVVHPDRAGRFDVVGVHIREHGGPSRDGEIPDSVPARYVGQLRGDVMTLRVFMGADTLGPLTLRQGSDSQLMKCL